MTTPLLLRAIATTAIGSAGVLFDAALGRRDPVVFDRHIDWWSGRLLRDVRIQVELRGAEHLQPGEAYVVMSNHQSHYDIPVVLQTLDLRVRMVTKAELFKIPLWGAAMRRAGFVEIDRGNQAQARAALSQAGQAIRRGTSIWIAPEGTRTVDGRLGPFKKGGFHLALDAGARILPVSIDGTRAVLPTKSFQANPGGKVVVTVSPPIDPAAFGPERLDALVAAVRHAIGAPLGEA